MGVFIIDARELDRLTPDGVFKYEKQLEDMLDEFLEGKIGWKEFVAKSSSLADTIEELFLIGGYIGIVGSDELINQLIDKQP